MSFRLDLQVVPNASRSEVIGWHGDRLKIKIKAPPVDGKANEEVIRFLAAEWGVRHSAITIVRGTTGRQKTVEIDAPDELRAKLPPR